MNVSLLIYTTIIYMADLRFSEDQLPNRRTNQPAVGGIIGFLIKRGIVKSAAAANMLLLAFIVIGLLLTAYLLTISTQTTAVPDLPPPGL